MFNLRRSKTSEKIVCVTGPNEPGEGFVRISIDDANVGDGSFLYLPNPSIKSVSPSVIIES